jgi:type II restriction enzyme
MQSHVASGYNSGCQQTRVITELWGERNLYCPNCSSPILNRLVANTRASDFRCPSCSFWFQLKGQKTRMGERINDGAYSAMMDAIQNDRTPSFYFMHYDLATWSVKNLLLISHFAFPKSAIIKRKPLSATARRAGWIGCVISLVNIPPDARIPVVKEGTPETPERVREQFRRVKPLADLNVKARGWTLDVLNGIRTLGKTEFTNDDACTLEQKLSALHPENRHVKQKIRQQLQVLRDLGLLIHSGRGQWRLP